MVRRRGRLRRAVSGHRMKTPSDLELTEGRPLLSRVPPKGVHLRLLVYLLTLAVLAICAAAASSQAAGASPRLNGEVPLTVVGASNTSPDWQPRLPADVPPPPDGYFTLQPVGAWSSLPSGASCASQVHR